jgi:hypothetical protein
MSLNASTNPTCHRSGQHRALGRARDQVSRAKSPSRAIAAEREGHHQRRAQAELPDHVKTMTLAMALEKTTRWRPHSGERPVTWPRVNKP